MDLLLACCGRSLLDGVRWTERGPVTRFNRAGETPATQPTTLPATQGVAAGE